MIDSKYPNLTVLSRKFNKWILLENTGNKCITCGLFCLTLFIKMVGPLLCGEWTKPLSRLIGIIVQSCIPSQIHLL